MANQTSIEWAEATLNAVVGCRKISPGCNHCYAIKEANIRKGSPNGAVRRKFLPTVTKERGAANWTGEITFTESVLLDVLKRRKPTTYFVNSMSDLFYEGVSDEIINKHFAVFALAPQHRFLVLTKRAERMRDYFTHLQDVVEDRINHASVQMGFEWNVPLNLPLPNVWLGVSVENQKYADERIPHLLQTPAAVRFLSVEPMLGEIDLCRYLYGECVCGHSEIMHNVVGVTSRVCTALWPGAECKCTSWRPMETVDWVIVGGESGPNARPMHPDWPRSLRDQCQREGVPFFFKQWGEYGWLGSLDNINDSNPWGDYSDIARDRSICVYPNGLTDPNGDPGMNGHYMDKCGKKKAGRLLDGREWNEMPEVTQ